MSSESRSDGGAGALDAAALVERACRFNCDAESSCTCWAHQLYRLVLASHGPQEPPNTAESVYAAMWCACAQCRTLRHTAQDETILCGAHLRARLHELQATVNRLEAECFHQHEQFKAAVLASHGSQDQPVRCPKCGAKSPERIAGLWLCQRCRHEWDDPAAQGVPPRERPDRQLSVEDLQMVASVFTDLAIEKAESEDPDVQTEAPEIREIARRADKQAFDLTRSPRVVPPRPTWQPIETAPKDHEGEPILTWSGEVHITTRGFTAALRRAGWFDERGFMIHPTHWQPMLKGPLPAPPPGVGAPPPEEKA